VGVPRPLGGPAAGLNFLQSGARLGTEGILAHTGTWTGDMPDSLLSCLRAQLDPTPPLAFGRALAEHDIGHAPMDLSAGRSGDLLPLCHASDVSAWVDGAALPVDPCAAQLEKEGGTDG